MIQNLSASRHEHVLDVARQMMTAADARKGKGVDIIEIAMVTGDDLKLLFGQDGCHGCWGTDQSHFLRPGCRSAARYRQVLGKEPDFLLPITKGLRCVGTLVLSPSSTGHPPE